MERSSIKQDMQILITQITFLHHDYSSCSSYPSPVSHEQYDADGDQKTTHGERAIRLVLHRLDFI
jgi:hypothetical protein